MPKNIIVVLAGIILFCRIGAGQSQRSPLPELPPDVPKDADIRISLSDNTPAGQDVVWKDAAGTIHEFFQFNDRGRGPKIYTTYRLDAKQLIAAEDSKGVDYMKAPVEEHFSITSGQAVWKNQAEDRTLANADGKFYVDVDG